MQATWGRESAQRRYWRSFGEMGNGKYKIALLFTNSRPQKIQIFSLRRKAAISQNAQTRYESSLFRGSCTPTPKPMIRSMLSKAKNSILSYIWECSKLKLQRNLGCGSTCALTPSIRDTLATLKLAGGLNNVSDELRIKFT